MPPQIRLPKSAYEKNRTFYIIAAGEVHCHVRQHHFLAKLDSPRVLRISAITRVGL